jgi:hypothetical protein
MLLSMQNETLFNLKDFEDRVKMLELELKSSKTLSKK